MPPLVAAAVIGAGATVGGAAMAARGASKAAKTYAQTADTAAQTQLQASRETEQWARQQAQHDYRQQETDRRANYGQYAARMGDINSYLQAYGYGPAPRTVPDYVPSVDPQYERGSVEALAGDPRRRDDLRHRPMRPVGAYL